ncbi:MAG: hypothetical protein PW734_10540 [Verrucomicrobium sp.]|nr:hypothetical protein [Verrucomicrobium sp.]
MTMVEQFVADCVAALDKADPPAEIEKLLQRFMADAEALKAALPPIDVEDYLLHQSPLLSIYHIRFEPGVGYPAHNHGMPVVSGIYEGVETNRIYREREDGKIEFLKEVEFTHPHTFIMRDGVHAASNRGTIPSLGFHIHVGDFYGAPHYLWDEKTGEKFPYSDKKFVELATYPPGYPVPQV